MLKFLSLFVPLSLFCTASYADNCDALREQIEGKIKAAGVASFAVVVVDSAASAPGKIVGTCAKGGKKIMYTQQSAAPGSAMPATVSSALSASKPLLPATKAADAILTECKDGSVSVGGSCKK
jgi:Protein of unknown function (DUF1161)